MKEVVDEEAIDDIEEEKASQVLSQKVKELSQNLPSRMTIMKSFKETKNLSLIAETDRKLIEKQFKKENWMV